MTQENRQNIDRWFSKNMLDLIKIIGLYGGVASILITIGATGGGEVKAVHQSETDIITIKADVAPLKDEIKNLTSAIDQKCDSMNNYNYYKAYWEQNYLYAKDSKKENRNYRN